MLEVLQDYKQLKDDIFYRYDSNEIFGRDAVEFHAMSYDHTEVLGQFIDRTGMNAEQLKDCLVRGWCNIL